MNRSLAERLGVDSSTLTGCPIDEVLGTSQEGSLGVCSYCGEGGGMARPVELLGDRNFLVSTINMVVDGGKDAQTVHVFTNIRSRLETERRYRDLFDTMKEGAFFCGSDGRMLEANQALLQLLGCSSHEELLRRNLFEDLLPPASRDRLLRELRESNLVRNFETEVRTQHGRPLEALLHVAAVRDPEGVRPQYRGLILDVTDQKESHAALRRERDFNRSILYHTQNIILVLDDSGRIEYVNRRSAEIGYSNEDLRGLPFTHLIHNSHRPVFMEALRAVLERDAVRRLKLPFLRKDGGIAYFVLHLNSMRNSGGDASNAVVVMTDVTQMSALENKLAHTEKMAALGRLVSGVAHEVNNPLSAIIGFADLLLENPELPPFAQEDLRVILDEAERTRLIVQNMLRFAREMPPQREPVQIDSVLRQVLLLRSYGLAITDVEFVERLADNLPIVVADPHQLEQVFLNILNNAFDAVEEVGRRGKIEVETAVRDGSVEISFRDNGPGISNMDRVFEPFFSTKPPGKGTGLGLSICYGIVRAHDGEIVCFNNQDGTGCTFQVRLPAVVIAAPDRQGA